MVSKASHVRKIFFYGALKVERKYCYSLNDLGYVLLFRSPIAMLRLLFAIATTGTVLSMKEPWYPEEFVADYAKQVGQEAALARLREIKTALSTPAVLSPRQENAPLASAVQTTFWNGLRTAAHSTAKSYIPGYRQFWENRTNLWD